MVVHGGKPKIRHKIIVDGIVVYGSSMGATKKYTKKTAEFEYNKK